MASASLNRKPNIIKQSWIGTSSVRWHGGNGHVICVVSVCGFCTTAGLMSDLGSGSWPSHVGWHGLSDMAAASEEEDWIQLVDNGPVGLLAAVGPPPCLGTTGPAEPLAPWSPGGWPAWAHTTGLAGPLAPVDAPDGDGIFLADPIAVTGPSDCDGTRPVDMSNWDGAWPPDPVAPVDPSDWDGTYPAPVYPPDLDGSCPAPVDQPGWDGTWPPEPAFPVDLSDCDSACPASVEPSTWDGACPAEPAAPVDQSDWDCTRGAQVDPSGWGGVGPAEPPSPVHPDDWDSNHFASPVDLPSVPQHDSQDTWAELLEDTSGTGCGLPPPPTPPPPPPHALAHDARRQQWASSGVSVLQPYFSHLQGQAHTLHYAGDCSGAEAPAVALEDIRVALGRIGVDFAVVHEYSSEHPGPEGDAPCRWLQANCRPLRMYRCMHQRVAGHVHGGPVEWCDPALMGTAVQPSEGKILVPSPASGTVDMYVGGYVCKDNSSANRHRRKSANHNGAGSRDSGGQSFGTYASSKKAIKTERPRRFILENVGMCPVESTVQDLRESLPQYFVTCFKTEALHFGAATRRLRVFIVGALKTFTTVPVSEWASLLTSLTKSVTKTGDASQWLLPVDDPYPATVFRGSRCSVSQQGDLKWMEEHARVRTMLANPPPMPTLDEIEAQCPSTGLANQREVDLKNLLWQTVKEKHGNPQTLDLYWDTSAEASHRWFLEPDSAGFVPCLLGNHKIFSSSRGRVLTGLEHMLLQKFPVASDFSTLSDGELRHLAGLSMNVPQVGMVMLVLLATTQWGPEKAPQATVAQCLQDAENLPVVSVIKPSMGVAMEPRTTLLPGLENPTRTSKRKATSSSSAVGLILPVTVQWKALNPAPSGLPSARTTSKLLDGSCNGVDLTSAIKNAFADTQWDNNAWPTYVAEVVSQVSQPVLSLGLLPGFQSSVLSSSNEDSVSICQQLMHAFAAVADAVIGQDWTCTSIRIQRECQQPVGYVKGRTGNRGDAHRYSQQRSFQFVWVYGSPEFADSDEPVDTQLADLWCEATDGSVAIGRALNFVCTHVCQRGCPPKATPNSNNDTQGPIPCAAIKLDWGRVSVDSAQRLIGEVYATPGRFLSVRQCHARIQDKWPNPSEYMCVEWLTSGNGGNQAECDADTLRQLSLLGFRDPSIGLEPQIPVEIVDSASGACHRFSDLEFGLEKMLDAEGVDPCDTGDVSVEDVDVAEEDWSELV